MNNGEIKGLKGRTITWACKSSDLIDILLDDGSLLTFVVKENGSIEVYQRKPGGEQTFAPPHSY